MTAHVNLIVEDLNSPNNHPADSCGPMSIPGEYEETPRFMLFIQNASAKHGLDGVYKVINKEQEKEYDLEDIDKQSLAVPTSPLESIKLQEMSSRMAILAKKFSLGKKVIKEMKKKKN
jgi:hypothetical protein